MLTATGSKDTKTKRVEDDQEKLGLDKFRVIVYNDLERGLTYKKVQNNNFKSTSGELLLTPQKGQQNMETKATLEGHANYADYVEHELSRYTSGSYDAETVITAHQTIQIARIADVMERLRELVESQMIHFNVDVR